jgi:hypothetical protein
MLSCPHGEAVMRICARRLQKFACGYSVHLPQRFDRVRSHARIAFPQPLRHKLLELAIRVNRPHDYGSDAGVRTSERLDHFATGIGCSERGCPSSLKKPLYKSENSSSAVSWCTDLRIPVNVIGYLIGFPWFAHMNASPPPAVNNWLRDYEIFWSETLQDLKNYIQGNQ